MVQRRTKREVRDNTGVRVVKCVQVKRGKKGKGAVGDRVVGSVKKARVGATWKRGDVVKGVLVSTAKEVRVNGAWVRYGTNAMIRLNAKREPVGTRIVGSVSTTLRTKGFAKRVSMAEHAF
jgi:large subunit ribosomal protein L14